MFAMSREKLFYIIVKARAFSVKMEPEVPDPGDNPTDDQDRQVLFDHADDPTAEELRDVLADLNEDEVAEMLALLWIGRGDYEPADWATAMAIARDDVDDQRADRLMAEPMLAEDLEEGLGRLGQSCAEFATRHL